MRFPNERFENFPAIRSLVPHAGAMVLLDRVVDADAETLCAEVTIRTDTLFCDGKGVGAWVGVEYMAQAIAAYAGYQAHQRGEPIKIGFLLGSRRYECSHSYFLIGQKLHVHVQRTLQDENGLGAFECTIVDADANIDAELVSSALANATITVFQPENASDFLQEVTNESAT